MVCVCNTPPHPHLCLPACVSSQATEGQKDQRPADAAGPSFLGPSGLPWQTCIQVWNHNCLFINKIGVYWFTFHILPLLNEILFERLYLQSLLIDTLSGLPVAPVNPPFRVWLMPSRVPTTQWDSPAPGKRCTTTCQCWARPSTAPPTCWMRSYSPRRKK